MPAILLSNKSNKKNGFHTINNDGNNSNSNNNKIRPRPRLTKSRHLTESRSSLLSSSDSTSPSPTSFDSTPFASFDENVDQNQIQIQNQFQNQSSSVFRQLEFQKNQNQNQNQRVMQQKQKQQHQQSQWDWDTLSPPAPTKQNNNNNIRNFDSHGIASPSSLNYPRKAASMVGAQNSSFDHHHHSRALHSVTSGNGKGSGSGSGNYKSVSASVSSSVPLSSQRRRRTTTTTANTYGSGIGSGSGNANSNANANTGTNTTNNDELLQLPNPQKISDQVPFRNRFANAAQRLKNDDDGDDDETPLAIFRQMESEVQQVPIPTQLFLHTNTNGNTNTNSNTNTTNNGGRMNHHNHDNSNFFKNNNTNKNNNNTVIQSSLSCDSHEWPQSRSNNIKHEINIQQQQQQQQQQRQQQQQQQHLDHHHWPISPNETSYESFGNQSVFSDITGSELSNSMAPSPARESRRKEAFHYNNFSNSNSSNNAASAFRKPVDALLKVNEEVDFEKTVDKTTSTHLSSSVSSEEAENQCETNHNHNRHQHQHQQPQHKSKSSQKKIKKQSRLASLFTSRGLIHNQGGDEKRRSKSAPKPRGASGGVSGSGSGTSRSGTRDYHADRLLASPGRSNASGSSSAYVGWPGTIGKDGATVEIESTFSDDTFGIQRTKLFETHVKEEAKPSQAQARSQEQAVNTKKQTSGGLYRTPKKNIIEKKVKKGIGRKLFDRRQHKSNDNDKKTSTNSRVLELRRQFEGDVVDLDEAPSSDSENEETEKKKEVHNPADIYLAKALTRVKSTSSSPSSSPLTVPDHELNMTYPGARNSSRGNAFDDLVNPRKTKSIRQRSTSSDVSQTPSKYSHNDSDESSSNLHIETTSSHDNDETSASFIDVSASLRRVRSALSPESLGSIPEGDNSFHLSEELLKRNEKLSPIRSNASGANVKGFLGFLDKTKDVPNLMDDESDSQTTASTMGTQRNLIRRTEIANWKSPQTAESDVFDGMTSVSGHSFIRHGKILSPPIDKEKEKSSKSGGRKFLSPKNDNEDVNIIKVNQSLTTIQSTLDNYNNRTTSVEFDATLTESDTDFFPNDDKRLLNQKPKIVPDWPQAENQLKFPPSAKSDIFDSDSSDSISCGENSAGPKRRIPHKNLSKYIIDPSKIRKMVKHYRNMSNKFGKWATDPSMTEDAKKAFALFEMRSRIMETDIERGLERTGGTSTVDDLVITSYYQASYRVRDAVVVSKAWREGASPSDARTAFHLTTGIARNYCVKRSLQSDLDNSVLSNDFSRFETNSSVLSDYDPNQFVLEKVIWVDDTEFSLLRCPSRGAGTLRGFDIFTVGDCQSILLKLTNEYCEELRTRLNEASSRQLIAEHIMKEEGESNDDIMTEAEDAYLEAMEEVKTLSNSLARAEKAFETVRCKIEELVSKYENMLDKMDKNPGVDSDSNCGDDDFSDASSLDQAAKDKLTRRAQRAELKAEVAAREAQMAKMEAEKSKQEMERIRLRKEEELKALQKKLDELEAKSVMMENDFEHKIQHHKTFVKDSFMSKVGFTNDMASDFNKNATAHSSLLYAASTVGIDQDKNEAKERIKARFRQRRSVDGNPSMSVVGNETTNQVSSAKQNKLSGPVQQRLQFYERSLKAVEKK